MIFTHLPSISCFIQNALYRLIPTQKLILNMKCFLSLKEKPHFSSIIKVIKYKKRLVFVNRLDRHSLIVTKEPYKRYVTTISSDLIMANIKEMELISIFIQRPKNFPACNSIRYYYLSCPIAAFSKSAKRIQQSTSFLCFQKYDLCNFHFDRSIPYLPAIFSRANR